MHCIQRNTTVLLGDNQARARFQDKINRLTHFYKIKICKNLTKATLAECKRSCTDSLMCTVRDTRIFWVNEDEYVCTSRIESQDSLFLPFKLGS